MLVCIVKRGEVVGILGRNGGGKSCLMKVIYGELRLKDQYVAIDGRPC